MNPLLCHILHIEHTLILLFTLILLAYTTAYAIDYFEND